MASGPGDGAKGPRLRVPQAKKKSKLDIEIEELQEIQRRMREKISLLRRPIPTLKWFLLAVLEYILETVWYLSTHRRALTGLLILVVSGLVMVSLDGPHHEYIHETLAYARYSFWWICLGVASSIGLGSGLHTFVLYLGPHVAAFTLKATQCGRVDLKSAAYDTAQWGRTSSWGEKDCSDIGEPRFEHFPSEHGGYKVPMFLLLQQVQLEVVLWGLGTALGELPPYFVSRTARLSGEKLKELEEVADERPSKKGTLLERLQRLVLRHGQGFGWGTILLFASVPNPFFDLAGITCGHFLVPFWKFFSATLLGKAVIKTHIQTFFIILVFNAAQVERIEHVLHWALEHAPVVGSPVLRKLLSALDHTRDKFADSAGATPSPKSKVANFSLATLWSGIVTIMLLGFLGSIVTTTARSYLYEKHKLELQALRAKHKQDDEGAPSTTPNDKKSA